MLKKNKQFYNQNYIELNNINLPQSQVELIKLYDTQEESFIRTCILAKIKNIIVVDFLDRHERQSRSPCYEQYHSSINRTSSMFGKDLSQTERNLYYSALFLKFLRKGFKGRNFVDGQVRLLFHVISLAIKYFFSQDQFKSFFTQITDFIDNHKERIFLAIDFFIEVIQTIEYNHEDCLPTIEYSNSNIKSNHCNFERHFITHHLNSMLMIANFFMAKFVLKDNSAIEDGLIEERFKLKASEQQIMKILDLLHIVISFDFPGQKYSQNEQTNQFSAIIIPTKTPKNSNSSQFEKWIKNSQWIKIYQILYNNSVNLKLKLTIIQLFGDMARIHMKFFKNKVNFRIHIQNIVYSFADIISSLDVSKKYDEGIQLAISIGYNLLKLTSPLTIPIFFQINPNLSRGLLDNIRNFLVQQIIQDQIFHSNIIYYYFKFFENLNKRLQFEKITIIQEYIESNVRQVCRNYEHYMRLFLQRLYKKKSYETGNERNNYNLLKEILNNYDIEQLHIYFSPFKIMKPRYPTVNSIQDLVVYICAKVQRSIYMLESYKLQTWEQEVALGMINQSIQKVVQWYNYTSYAKKNTKLSTSKEKIQQNLTNSQKKQLLKMNMQPIVEEYYEEIQNQEEYCHLLRIISFFIINLISEKDFAIKYVNKDHKLMRLISVVLELCFFSDINEHQKKEGVGSTIIISKIIQFLEKSMIIVQKSLSCSWQHYLYNLSKQQNKKLYNLNKNFSQQIQFIQMIQIDDKLSILKMIKRINSHNNIQILTCLKKIEFYIGYSISKQLNKQLQQILFINNLSELIIYLQTLQLPIILQLIQLQQPFIMNYIYYIKHYLNEYQLKNNNSQIIKYIECIIEIRKLKNQQIQEEFTNKIYLIFKQIVFLINNQGQNVIDVSFQLIRCMQRVNQEIFAGIRDLDFQQLYREVNQIIYKFENQNIYNQSPKCTSFEAEKDDKIETKGDKDGYKLDLVDDKTEICESIYSNNTGKQNKCDNIKQQEQFFDVKSIYKYQKQKMDIQQAPIHPIYIGYHQQKLNMIVNKYIQDQVNTSQEIQMIQMPQRQMSQLTPNNSKSKRDYQQIQMTTQKQQNKQEQFHSHHSLFNGPQINQPQANIPNQNKFQTHEIINLVQQNIPMVIQLQFQSDNKQQLFSIQNNVNKDEQNDKKNVEYSQKDVNNILPHESPKKDYIKQIEKMVMINENHLGISPQFIGEQIIQLEEINQQNNQDLISNQPTSQQLYQVQCFKKTQTQGDLIIQNLDDPIIIQLDSFIKQQQNESQSIANETSQKTPFDNSL